MRHVVIFGALTGALTACDGSIGKDEDGASCGTNPPVFSEFQLIDDGETATVGGSDKRVFEISAIVTDADGDLHDYFLDIYIDGFSDGNLPLTPTIEVSGEAGTDDSCVVTEATVGAYVPFGPGTDRAFGETIEIGMVVFDAAGHASHDTPLLKEWDLPTE